MSDIIRVAAGRQSCECEEECECMPDLIFLANGKRGYGAGTWTQSGPTGRPAYLCRFLGMQFTAGGQSQAAAEIRQLLSAFSHVEVSP